MAPGLDGTAPAIIGEVDPVLWIVKCFEILVIAETSEGSVIAFYPDGTPGSRTIILSFTKDLTGAAEVVRIDRQGFGTTDSYENVTIGVNFSFKVLTGARK